MKKTLTLKSETWKKLSQLKLDYNFSSMDSLLTALIKNTDRLREVLNE